MRGDTLQLDCWRVQCFHAGAVVQGKQWTDRDGTAEAQARAYYAQQCAGGRQAELQRRPAGESRFKKVENNFSKNGTLPGTSE